MDMLTDQQTMMVVDALAENARVHKNHIGQLMKQLVSEDLDVIEDIRSEIALTLGLIDEAAETIMQLRWAGPGGR